jgi:hypothetical protein
MITLVYTALAALLIGLNVADWRLTRAIILLARAMRPIQSWHG